MFRGSRPFRAIRRRYPFNITAFHSRLVSLRRLVSANTAPPRLLSNAEDQAVDRALEGQQDQRQAAERKWGIMLLCVKVAVADEGRKPHYSVDERVYEHVSELASDSLVPLAQNVV